MNCQRFTVILRGEHHFSLSKAQIEHDSPENNFFACCFLKDFKEGASRVVELDQDPALFTIIVQHMSGYQVLPLSPDSLPMGMTHEVAMINLARDARFFGLERLYGFLTSPALPPHIGIWDDFTGPIVEFDDVINGRLHSGIMYTDRGLCADTGNGVLRNVLVYGKNMRLDLAWKWFSAMPDAIDPEYGEEGGFGYDFYLGLSPAQLRALEKQHDGWINLMSSTPGLGDRLIADQSRRRDGSFHIDGRRTLFLSLPLWLHHLHYSPLERTQKPRYEEIRVYDEAFPGTVLPFGFENESSGDEFHLWVDEAFFLIRSRTDFGRASFRLELLDVKTRTRGAILDASFPPLRPET